MPSGTGNAIADAAVGVRKTIAAETVAARAEASKPDRVRRSAGLGIFSFIKAIFCGGRGVPGPTDHPEAFSLLPHITQKYPCPGINETGEVLSHSNSGQCCINTLINTSDYAQYP